METTTKLSMVKLPTDAEVVAVRAFEAGVAIGTHDELQPKSLIERDGGRKVVRRSGHLIQVHRLLP